MYFQQPITNIHLHMHGTSQPLAYTALGMWPKCVPCLRCTPYGAFTTDGRISNTGASMAFAPISLPPDTVIQSEHATKVGP